MTAEWRKLGLIYRPTGRDAKLLSHAANPLPLQLDGDVYRIFYSGRDASKRSSVGAVDIDIVNRTIMREHDKPFFLHGEAGTFFADGVSIGNCYETGGVRYMLFMGWQNPPGGHWHGDIGRLVVKPDLTLELDNKEPFMGCDAVDPISLSYPWVTPEATGGYRMWYGSTTSWDAGNGEMLHVINTASSTDGHRWSREGLAVPFELGRAQAFSRPTVARSAAGGYGMWFSYRGGNGKTYRIGHACSADGASWDLSLDAVGLDVSNTGWDSEMVEYPFVFDHRDRRYMLYNGNGYGSTGFGMAELVEAADNGQIPP